MKYYYQIPKIEEKMRILLVIIGLSYSQEPCGGQWTSGSGVVLSPNHPNSYPSNADCNYFLGAAGNNVELTFTNFAIERGPGCQYDFLGLVLIH